MKFYSKHCFRRSAKVLLLAASVTVASTAWADSFYVSFLGAGVQTPAGVTSYYETFDSGPAGSYLSTPFVTNFGGSPYTGTYTGGLYWHGASVDGGAGGTGVFPDAYFGSYSVAINPSVNYFGLWFSALDAGNQLQFYNGTTLLYTFTPTDFMNLVGACPGGPYCGNPNADFLNGNNGQQYAYLNFYDQTGSFNNVVFTQTIDFGAFESDNHAVAVLSSDPGGTPITTGTPEPATLELLACAALALALLSLRLRKRPL